MTPPILFASDLHLCESDPDTLQSFIAFLRGPVRHASALYLLGDIFEYWAGDDDDDPLLDQIAGELAAVTSHGIRLLIQHGNRDFLLGPAFAARAGATLLSDPYYLEAFDQRLILSHGDTLCTDDVAYQAFRCTVRDPAWINSFLGLPLAVRKAEIAKLRAASRMATRDKEREIMDVNDIAVSRLLAQLPGAHLIHGHTHRPGQHQHEVQHGLRQRWVLADWSAGHGGYLGLDGNGIFDRPFPA